VGRSDDGAAGLDPARALGPNDLFLLNSTSGTTGLPKCVTQFQNRWVYFHQLATEAGALTEAEVFMSAVPAPFGFGLWTAHFTPALLGAPVVVMDRFTPELMIELIERHRVTVLSCVSTQFVMMLNSPALEDHDLTSLRVMFTGGEPVPVARSTEFEERVGASVLQFFGSNETGALSRTTLTDSRERRLTTAGRMIPEMEVRLFDVETGAALPFGVPGQPGGRGPALCAGYFDDAAANRMLYTDDGWMLMGDVCSVDSEGYLTLVGRTSDIIIRGGKNISAVAVEAEVGTHPSVLHAAAIGMPDPVFGERVCVFVESTVALPLEDLVEHLRSRGVSAEWWPERLEVRAALPRSTGEKIAKGELRAEIERLLATEAEAGTIMPR
jgi:acyl-CoA synthetase